MALGKITPCDRCGEKPIFFAYPLLVCNPFDFDYTLVKQEEFPDTIFVEGCFTIDARDEKRNHYLYTYTGDDCSHLIGERVTFTFVGVKRKSD